jgi:hypothetical protein
MRQIYDGKIQEFTMGIACKTGGSYPEFCWGNPFEIYIIITIIIIIIIGLTKLPAARTT